jgi:Fe-S cluster assembly iron-binding protein IscA
MSIEYLCDCEVDYEEELIRAGFKVAANTLADSACGCGSSFSVQNF